MVIIINNEIERTVIKFKLDLLKIFNERLLDIIIYGSSIRGGFNPSSSDIDFIVFINGELSESDINSIKDFHSNSRSNESLDKLLEGRYIAIEDNEMINGYYVGTNPLGWKSILETGFGPIESAMILDAYLSLNKTDLVNEFISFKWNEVIEEIYQQLDEFLSNELLGKDNNYTNYAMVTSSRSYYLFNERKFISKQGAFEYINHKQLKLEKDNPVQYIETIKKSILPITYCETKEELDSIFEFMSINLNFNIKNKKYVDSQRDGLYKQFDKDNRLILLIKDKDKVISALSMKHKDDSEITMGMLATDKIYHELGLGRRLVRKIEDECKKREYKRISLGARESSAKFYFKLGYNPMIMIQVFNKQDLSKALDLNIENSQYKILNIIDTKDNKSIFLKVDRIDTKDINVFRENIQDLDIQYVFTKDI